MSTFDFATLYMTGFVFSGWSKRLLLFIVQELLSLDQKVKLEDCTLSKILLKVFNKQQLLPHRF